MLLLFVTNWKFLSLLLFSDTQRAQFWVITHCIYQYSFNLYLQCCWFLSHKKSDRFAGGSSLYTLILLIVLEYITDIKYQFSWIILLHWFNKEPWRGPEHCHFTENCTHTHKQDKCYGLKMGSIVLPDVAQSSLPVLHNLVHVCQFWKWLVFPN